MSRQIFCAECGTELTILHKALPKQQKVILVIAPHSCPDEHPDYPFKDINNELLTRPDPGKPKSDLDKLFNDFKFVQKSNELNKKPTINPLLTPNSGDKRSKDLIRDNTIAPPGILDAVKSKPGKD